MQDLHSPAATPFKDRTARLTLFGALAILAGAGGIVLGLLHLVLLLGARHVPGLETMPVDARSYVMGAALYVLLGAAFVWVGAGSVKKRRWARPLMLTLAWTWLLGGVSVLLLLPGLLDLALGMNSVGSAPPDPTVAGLVQAAMMLGTSLLGVALPALFLWAYYDDNVPLTCDSHDPKPDWTRNCPPPVLGLSVGLGACGVIGLLMVLRPVVPLFGRLVTGWPAALSLVAVAGACLWMARETYALRVRGWWTTTTFVVLAGLSTWLTLARVPASELFLAMGYPEDSVPEGEASFGRMASWLTVVVTLATVVYMAGIRKHFLKSAGSG
jgi:hypothetical protein